MRCGPYTNISNVIVDFTTVKNETGFADVEYGN